MAKKKRRKRRPRAEVGMRPYANRVKAMLKAHDALPRFRQDLTVIEDLARLAWHVPVLDRCLRDIVDDSGGGDGRPLEARLGALASDVESVHDLCRAVRGPLRRLLKTRRGSRAGSPTLVPFAGGTRKPGKDEGRPDAP